MFAHLGWALRRILSRTIAADLVAASITPDGYNASGSGPANGTRTCGKTN
jgi:hypothetical protein